MNHLTRTRKELMSEDELPLLSADDVAQLFEVAWLTYCDSPLDRLEPDGIDRPDVIYASVSVGGPHCIAIHLHFTPALARRYAAAVLGSDYRESNEDDVYDVLGELANVIGGNYKGAMSEGEPWTLSLPTVSRTTPRLPQSRVTTQVSFLCEGELIECHVLEHL
jgi:chemotaxis protein CheX